MSNRYQFILAIFFLLGAIALGVYQWNERSALVLEAAQLTSEASNLTTTKKQLEEEYQVVKVEVTAERETAAQELSSVFPSKEDITSLSRLFDEFSVTNNFDANPFFISSLTYGEEVAEAGYRYVKVSVNFTASKKNLSKFLEFIETSGSLEGEARLMSVEDLTVNYPSEYGGTYEVQAEINAYYSQEL